MILGSLNNFIGIICQSCNVCLPNFNTFGNLGRNFITEKLKGSLIAPVLMTSKSVTCPMHLLGQVSLPISITELCRKLSQGGVTQFQSYTHVKPRVYPFFGAKYSKPLGHEIVTLLIRCECCTSYLSWHWLIQWVISCHVYKLFGTLFNIFVDKL